MQLQLPRGRGSQSHSHKVSQGNLVTTDPSCREPTVLTSINPVREMWCDRDSTCGRQALKKKGISQNAIARYHLERRPTLELLWSP
jgi:hypothetical protein